jgi:hypothetical protein
MDESDPSVDVVFLEDAISYQRIDNNLMGREASL